jgi:flagellar hook-associated protein 1 FlgK
MGLLGGLNTARDSLATAQIGVSTTSHNISNAENENYTRQRVVQSTTNPSPAGSGDLVGTGTQVSEISRVHDEFVFTRYQASNERLTYSDTLKQNLQEISGYFPDMDGVGLKNDIENYFSSWSSLAQQPDSLSQKTVLIADAKNLAKNIQSTFEKVDKIQNDINSDIKSSIDEVNSVIKQIASMNKEIVRAEAGGATANDFRDKRDALETQLSKLVGAEFVHGNISANSRISMDSKEAEGVYTAMVDGVSIVSGTTYHELTVSNKKDQNGYYHIDFKKSDGTTEPMESRIQNGKVGALLALRGNGFSDGGELTNGIIPELKDNLNSFAKGLIQHTNSIYSESASSSMTSDRTDMLKGQLLTDNPDIREGSFNIVMYDRDGVEVGKRVINIDDSTTLDNGENSLMAQLRREYDDNGDNSLFNDFASQFDVGFSGGVLSITGAKDGNGYTFGIEDNGTNFAGAMGMQRFFSGEDATDIAVDNTISRDHTTLKANRAPFEGDNGVADKMMTLQTDSSWDFGGRQESIKGFYDFVATDLAITTENVNIRNESISVQFNSIKLEMDSISKVNIDEELVSLMKYQTAYSASGKVISTIDQMINTLLGIKQ